MNGQRHSTYEESLRLLEDHHEFPGLYTFKIIGPNRPDWFSMIKESAECVLGPVGDCLQPAAQSTGQRYQSLNLTIHVATATQVLEVYAVLKQVPEVKMLL